MFIKPCDNIFLSRFLYMPAGDNGEEKQPELTQAQKDAQDLEETAQQRNKISSSKQANIKAWQYYNETQSKLSDEDIFKNINYEIPGEDYNDGDNFFARHYDDFTQTFGGSKLQFELPDWGVEDYINDRSKWVKGIWGANNEPGWFYFKVFFNFKTNFGLFGGLVDIGNMPTFEGNCAARFLKSINGLYYDERPSDRLKALQKFAAFLSKINTHYPWLINKITGLGPVFKPIALSGNFDEEKKITLGFCNEQIDMKILNLLSLYRYVCYDDINCKEILPSNLRKFDMMIMLYHVPVKYLQTAIMVANKNTSLTTFANTWLPGSVMEKVGGTLDVIEKTLNFLTSQSKYFAYKRMVPNNNDFSNMMSFHMITLQNCEFDPESFVNYFDAGEFSSEAPTKLENVAIEIKYDRAYHHTMNEWNQYLFGSDGFYYEEDELDHSLTNTHQHLNRLKALKQSKESGPFFDQHAGQYKRLIDYTESLITDGLLNMQFKDYYLYEKGNIYGDVDVNSSFQEYRMSLQKGVGYKGNLFGGYNSTKSNDDNGQNINVYLKDKVKYNKESKVTGNLFGETSETTVNNLIKLYDKLKLKSYKQKLTDDEKAQMQSGLSAKSATAGPVSTNTPKVDISEYVKPVVFKKTNKTALEWLQEKNNKKSPGWEGIKSGLNSFFGGW